METVSDLRRPPEKLFHEPQGRERVVTSGRSGDTQKVFQKMKEKQNLNEFRWWS
jgi:hypothetical protein